MSTDLRYLFFGKFDLNGDSLWTRKIPSPPGFHFNGDYLIQTADSGFLITGQIVDTSSSDGDISIVKTDSLGNYQWHQTYGGLSDETAVSIIKLHDMNYLIGSGKGNFAQSASEGKMIKIDSSGTIIWQKLHGAGVDSYIKVIELVDHNIVGCGSIRKNGLDDGFLIKTDSSGNEIWRRQYRYGNEHCYFRDVKQTSDGGFICAGFVFEGASGGQDGWLIKLDSTGCLANSCGEPTGIIDTPKESSYEISVYPNPVIDKAVITIKGLNQIQLSHRFVIELYGIDGKKVDLSHTGILIFDEQIQFEILKGSLNSGLYILKAYTTSNELLGIVKIVIK